MRNRALKHSGLKKRAKTYKNAQEKKLSRMGEKNTQKHTQNKHTNKRQENK